MDLDLSPGSSGAECLSMGAAVLWVLYLWGCRRWMLRAGEYPGLVWIMLAGRPYRHRAAVILMDRRRRTRDYWFAQQVTADAAHRVAFVNLGLDLMQAFPHVEVCLLEVRANRKASQW